MTQPLHSLTSPVAASAMSGDNLLSHLSNDHCNGCPHPVPAHLKVGLSCGCGPFHIECVEKVRYEARRNVDFKKRPQASPMSEFNCPRCHAPVVDVHHVPDGPKEPETPKPSAPPSLYPAPSQHATPIGYPKSPGYGSIQVPQSSMYTPPPEPHGGQFYQLHYASDPMPMHEMVSPSRIPNLSAGYAGSDGSLPQSWPPVPPLSSFQLPRAWVPTGSPRPQQTRPDFVAFSPVTNAPSAPPISSTEPSLVHDGIESMMYSFETRGPSFENQDPRRSSFENRTRVSFEKYHRHSSDTNTTPRPPRDSHPGISQRSVWSRASSALSVLSDRSGARSSHISTTGEEALRNLPSVPSIMPRSPSLPPRARRFRDGGRRENGRHSLEDGSRRPRQRRGPSDQTREFASMGSLRGFVTGGRPTTPDAKVPHMFVNVRVDVINHDCSGVGCSHCAARRSNNRSRQSHQRQRGTPGEQRRGRSSHAAFSRGGNS